ncbi:tRNA lysidine(34) synthetase TilS [Roseivirga sp.]|uniref:tRNA lysidine(34) synthetase TilS n=1 Tax=Roseivirga sp. TaxID=1964215 RepID=UPI003B52BA25
MLDRFLEFIKKHALFNEKDKLLLAVSGGVDSMVLLHLMQQTNYPFAVAHCNFQLRGNEADQDEALVRNTCEKHRIECYIKSFNTLEHASEKGISTQMAARDLRFEWFRALCHKKGYPYVALAHHQDDSIETFFINLARGTSLRGLRGIQAKNDNLVRPLLSFSKEEIVAYAQKEGIDWREDASNQQTYYKRNLIRHELVPVLQKLNPDFMQVMGENLEKLNDRYSRTEVIYSQLREKLIQRGNGGYIINKEAIREECQSAYDVYELLRPFHFNYATCQQLFKSIDQSGAVFKSKDYRLNVDREDLLISSANDTPHTVDSFRLDGQSESFDLGTSRYLIQSLPKIEWQLDRDPANAAFDFNRLQFPLEVRPWQEGDKIQPIGMKGKKLISDLLIDLKVPNYEKSKVMVMCSGKEIIWVIGIRISDSFKVTETTVNVWQIKRSNPDH